MAHRTGGFAPWSLGFTLGQNGIAVGVFGRADLYFSMNRKERAAENWV